MESMVRQKLKKYLEENQVPIADLAPMLGYSRTALSKYLSGDYNNPERIERAIDLWFKREAGAAKNGLKIGFREIHAARGIFTAANEARGEMDIAVIVGTAGVGKTFALEHYIRVCRLHGGTPVALITANVLTTARGIVNKIARAIDAQVTGTGSDRMDQIVARLKKKPFFLIIDEANHLNVRGIEVLRYIHDQAGVGLLLCGTKELLTTMTDGGRRSQDLAQLYSRVGLCRILPGLSKKELREIVQAALGNVDELTLEAIATACGFPTTSFRRVVKLIPRIQAVCEANATDANVETVKLAMGQMIA